MKKMKVQKWDDYATIGCRITDVLAQMVNDAKRDNIIYQCELNGVWLSALPNSSSEWLYKIYDEVLDIRHERYVATDEYKKQQEELKKKRQAKKDAYANMCRLANTNPKLNDDYIKWLNGNTDPYGTRICTYAFDVARFVEYDLDNGMDFSSAMKKNERIADHDGITGYMHGAAIGILKQCWEHGSLID